jgi:outer membrane receptor for ferrienterochelin and colicins
MRSKIVTLLFTLCANTLVYATDDTALEQEIRYLQAERMVEVVSKQKENRNSAAGVVSIVTGRDIERYGGNNLFEILNRVASLYMMGTPLRSQGTAAMRGDSTAQHILILMNGRPMRDSIFGGLLDSVLRDFPIHHLKKIEVIHGPGSVLYGSNAFAGVINLITLKKPDHNFTLRGRYGSFDTKQFETEASWHNETALISGAVRYRNSRGQLFSTNVLKNNTISSSNFRNDNDDDVSLSLTAEWHNFSLNGFYSHSQRHHWGPARLSKGQDYEPQRLFLDLGYKQELNSHWLTQWNFTYNQMADNQYVPTPGQNSIPTFTRSSENNLLFEQTQFLNFFDKNLNISLGGLVEWQSGRINQATLGSTLPEYSHLKSSIYTEISYLFWKKLKLTAGGQWNHFEYLNKVIKSADDIEKPVNGLVGRLALVYSISPNLGIKLLYSQAFRSASAFELGIESGPIHGNDDLNPERVETIDGQIFYHDKKYQLSLTGFRSRQSQFISLICYSNQPCSYVNRGSGIYQGIELETQGQLLPGLSWTAAYTFQTNYDGTGQNNFSPVPNHLAKLGLNYDISPDLKLSLFDSFASAAKLLPNPQINPNANSYHFLSLNSTYQLDSLLKLHNQHLSFSLYLDNLLNYNIYYPSSRLDSFNSIPTAYSTRRVFGELSLAF